MVGRTCHREFGVALAFAAGCVVVTGALVAANAALRGANPWGDDRDGWRCEEARDDLFREPFNTLSNLGFVFVGAYILLAAWRDARHVRLDGPGRLTVEHFPSVQAMVGFSSIFEGYGSFHYHACGSMCSLGATLDIAGIIVLVWSLTMLAAVFLVVACAPPQLDASSSRLQRRVTAAAWIAYVGGVILAALWRQVLEPLGMANLKFVMLAFFGLLIALLLSAGAVARCRGIQPNYDWHLTPLALISLVVAVLAWFPEEVNGECADVPLELHAIWHVFISLAILFSFVYGRSVGSEVVKRRGLASQVLLRQPTIGDSVGATKGGDETNPAPPSHTISMS